MFHVHILIDGSPFAVSIPLLLLFGLVVGVLGGFFGVGGGWIITPFLFIFCGLPETYAVGTGFGYILGMSMISAWKHRKQGNMEYRLGALLGVPMIVGVILGKWLMAELEKHGTAAPVVQGLYMIMLFSLGIYIMIDTIKGLRGAAPTQEAHDHIASAPLRNVTLGPGVLLPKAGIEAPLIAIVLIGFVVGVLSGLMGVGGGFLLMPIMVYLVGVPTIIAVGTSLLCILYASPMGVYVYHFAEGGSQVLFRVAGAMVVGALLGAPLGVWAAHRVHGNSLRLLYAILTLLGGLSVSLKFGQQFVPWPVLGELGKWLIFVAPLVLTVLVLCKAAAGTGSDQAAPVSSTT